MTQSVIYLGDTHLENAAAYLAGLMHAWDWEFDYVRSDESPSEDRLDAGHALYILSDYPSANLTDAAQAKIVERIADGAGLIMIGGWESFHGVGGDWDGTPIGDKLPVEIADTDDRVNCDHPVLVAKTASHPAVDGLPWEERPPLIGGFNRVTAKADANVLLEARHFKANRNGEVFQFEPTESDPLLVVGEYGQGRVAALTTDVAPHWVGPLVDWGDGRVTAQADGAGDVEVGDLYARFFRQLLEWLRNN